MACVMMGIFALKVLPTINQQQLPNTVDIAALSVIRAHQERLLKNLALQDLGKKMKDNRVVNHALQDSDV